MRHRSIVFVALLTLGACAAPVPTPSRDPSVSPSANAGPAVTCGKLAATDCQAGVAAVLAAVAGHGTVMRIDIDTGIYCPTPGLLFKVTSCPAGGVPPPGGGERIGHALVTFRGSSARAYLNIEKDGQTVIGALIALATPAP